MTAHVSGTACCALVVELADSLGVSHTDNVTDIPDQEWFQTWLRSRASNSMLKSNVVPQFRLSICSAFKFKERFEIRAGLTRMAGQSRELVQLGSASFGASMLHVFITRSKVGWYRTRAHRKSTASRTVSCTRPLLSAQLCTCVCKRQ